MTVLSLRYQRLSTWLDKYRPGWDTEYDSPLTIEDGLIFMARAAGAYQPILATDPRSVDWSRGISPPIE